MASAWPTAWMTPTHRQAMGQQFGGTGLGNQESLQPGRGASFQVSLT